MNTKQTEALKLALEVLEEINKLSIGENAICLPAEIDTAMDAIREALAEQPAQQEPVAWISDSPTKGNGKQLHWTKSEAWRWSSNITPLYTAPSKQWVGLTADEIWKCNKAKSGSAVEFHICYEHQNVEDFAEAIEAKLREKNT